MCSSPDHRLLRGGEHAGSRDRRDARTAGGRGARLRRRWPRSMRSASAWPPMLWGWMTRSGSTGSPRWSGCAGPPRPRRPRPWPTSCSPSARRPPSVVCRLLGETVVWGSRSRWPAGSPRPGASRTSRWRWSCGPSCPTPGRRSGPAGSMGSRPPWSPARPPACPPQDRARVDEDLCGDPTVVEGLSPRRLVGRLQKAAADLDPAAVVKRRARAEADRHVTLRPAPDVMTWLGRPALDQGRCRRARHPPPGSSAGQGRR